MFKYSILFGLLLLLVVQTSLAEITAASVAPAALTVDIDSGFSGDIQWSVTLNRENAVSDQAQFIEPFSDGPLETVNTTIVVPAPVNSQQPQLVTQSEGLLIPAATAQFWWSVAIREVDYIRVFSDSSGRQFLASVRITLVSSTPDPAPAPVPVPNPGPAPVPDPDPVPAPNPVPVPEPTPPGPGPVSTPPPIVTPQFNGLKALRQQDLELTVQRLELRFTDLKSIAFIDQKESLQAQLEVAYTGNGILRGQWQIADPASTSGDLRFYTLAMVNQQLSSVSQTQILSPKLPTSLVGRHYVRFCVTGIGNVTLPENNSDPQCASEIISTLVGYQVFPVKAKIIALTGLGPAWQSVDSKALFNWPAITSASVNQLQVLTDAGSKTEHFATTSAQRLADYQFIAGMLLPGDITQTTLTDHILAKLKPGKTYYWRISAYDNEGRLLARSKVLEFTYTD